MIRIVAIALLWATVAPPAAITNTVGVCDPYYPTRCLAPTVDGSSPINGRGNASIATSQVSVAATATLVAAARATRNAVTVTNLGAVDVFCGTAGVTTTTGTLLVGTKGAALTIPTIADVYCIVAAATQSVTVLETY